MKIKRNVIEFAGKNVDIKTSTKNTARMDYILSMLTDLIISSLKHLNRPEIWRDDVELFQIQLPLANRNAVLSIVNTGGNKIQVLIDDEIMEESDEFVFANEFLKNVQSSLPDLISDFEDQKTVYSQIKADLRSDLNHLELVIDRYER